jgi:starch phosphorylase
VSVVSVDNGGAGEVAVGSLLSVEAQVRLGALGPGDVKVEAYSGVLTPEGRLGSGHATPLAWVAQTDDVHMYRGAVVCDTSGARGYAVRVLPAQAGILIPHELALVTWE